MHEIDATPMTSAFQSCWYAGAKHLEAQGQGAINWFRAHPFPPYLEHLSFRLGNQLFFVRIEDVDGLVLGPGNREGTTSVAEGTNGHACLMYMKNYGGDDWRCVSPGWGLLNMSGQSTIAPVALITDEELPVTDWELQDFAVQIVRHDLEKAGKQLMSWQSNPEVHPSIWYVDDGTPTWVVVKAARYPATSAEMPTETQKLISRFGEMGHPGQFGLVSVANINDPFDPMASENGSWLPLVRGECMSVRYSGLVSIEEAVEQGGGNAPDLARDLVDELIHKFESAFANERLLPKVFVAQCRDGQHMTLWMDDAVLDPKLHLEFMRYVIEQVDAIAFAYKMFMVALLDEETKEEQEQHVFVSGTVGSYHWVEITSTASEGWVFGATDTKRQRTDTPTTFFQELLPDLARPTRYPAEVIQAWREVNAMVVWQNTPIVQ